MGLEGRQKREGSWEREAKGRRPRAREGERG
jgi:hypothetical protein